MGEGRQGSQRAHSGVTETPSRQKWMIRFTAKCKHKMLTTHGACILLCVCATMGLDFSGRIHKKSLALAALWERNEAATEAEWGRLLTTSSPCYVRFVLYTHLTISNKTQQRNPNEKQLTWRGSWLPWGSQRPCLQGVCVLCVRVQLSAFGSVCLGTCGSSGLNDVPLKYRSTWDHVCWM